MRLKIFLAVSLLAAKAVACTFTTYTPSDTYLYRIMEDISSYTEPCLDYYSRTYFNRSFDFRQENLRLWREQTGTKMSDERLELLVYGRACDVPKDAFNNCIKANELLKTAKEVQRIRKAMSDPWYFPRDKYGRGIYTSSLEDLAEECRQNANGVFRGRYVLQGLRCLNATRNWSDAIEFWEQQRDSLPDDVIRTMAEREVAAAYHQMGSDSIAADIYARVGDIASLRFCRTNQNNEMEYIYEHCPDSPYFPEEIQALLTYFDKNHSTYPQWYEEWRCYLTWGDEDSLRATNFLNLCRRVLCERKVKNPAMWCYAAAATLDALGNPKGSVSYISEGERVCKDEFLHKSFRLLRMHVEAQILPLNNEYFQKLFRDLQWLTYEIDKNMNQTEKSLLSKLTNYQWDSNTYYWNDAMRRILLSDLCSRLITEGQSLCALQLANFADYYLFRKLGNKTTILREWRNIDWDEFSYSSDLFAITEKLSAQQLASYVNWQSAGKDNLGRFLASYSNHDAAYWYDIVGTHYLREKNYKEAVRWFSRLPKDYECKMNICREWDDYMKRNPFDLSVKDPNPHRSRLGSTANYKLNFAKKMAQYENDMKYGSTANIRGESKVYYAAGLKNQYDYCWALTKYSFSCEEYTEWDEEWNRHENAEYTAAKEESERLMQEGLDEIIDPELKAKLLHAMQRNREIMQYYPYTSTAYQLWLHCDTWRDYVSAK